MAPPPPPPPRRRAAAPRARARVTPRLARRFARATIRARADRARRERPVGAAVARRDRRCRSHRHRRRHRHRHRAAAAAPLPPPPPPPFFRRRAGAPRARVTARRVRRFARVTIRAFVDRARRERPVAAVCVSCRWSLTRRRVTSRPHRKPSLQIKCTGASTRRRKRFMASPPPSPSSRSSFLHLGWRALLSRLTAERSCSTSSASAPPQLQRPIRRSPGTFVGGR